MRCKDIQDDLLDVTSPDYVSTDPDIRAHLDTCDRCRAATERATHAWMLLSDIADEQPDSDSMRARFAHSVKRHRVARTFAWSAWRPAFAAAAVLVALVGGIAIGRYSAAGPAVQPNEVSDMRAELRAVREMLTLSLLQQTAASERIKGVTSAAHMVDPPSDVVAALLDALQHDPNVNVRLTCVRALERFSMEPSVRAGVVRAVTTEVEPLVSIALIDFIVDSKNAKGIEALRTVSEDAARDGAVRETAARGVRTLTGGRI